MVRSVYMQPAQSGFGAATAALFPTIRFQCVDKRSTTPLELSIYDCVDGISRHAQLHSGASSEQLNRMKRRQKNLYILQLAAGALEMDME
jgi:predicted nucleic acid-binding Zn ribbon protein